MLINLSCLCVARGGESLSMNYVQDLNSRGISTLRMWMDDVSCTGDETSLDECRMNPGGWGVHNCQDTENAGCSCRASENKQSGMFCASLIGPVL